MKRERRSEAGPIALFVVSAVCLATAPLLLPSSYSWVVQTTCESAAQGVEGAWLARMGFLLWGFVLGVLGVMLHKLRQGSRRVTLDVIAMAFATLIPICMAIWGDVDGLLQRLMFLIAYAW